MYGRDIITAESYQVEKEYCQHGVISTYEHSLAVTYTSVYLALRSKKPVNMRSIVRGALLHDFYMYDWHNPEVKGNPKVVKNFSGKTSFEQKKTFGIKRSK